MQQADHVSILLINMVIGRGCYKNVVLQYILSVLSEDTRLQGHLKKDSSSIVSIMLNNNRILT